MNALYRSVADDQARHGPIGRDVLPVGRWLRMVAGVALLVVAGLSSVQFTGSPAKLAGIAAVLVVAAGYPVVFSSVGGRLFGALDPWVRAIVLIAPALLLLLFPAPLAIGYDAFLGVSMIVQASIAYGGCEVMGIPTLFLRRRYTVYCAFNGGDVVERWLVNQPAAARWAISAAAFLATIGLMGIASVVGGPSGELVLYLAFLVVGFALSRAVGAVRAARAPVSRQANRYGAS
ncbi:MAG: hypothetical protein KGJ86_03695 [Chloroflexota bacterium]|nr:hypothetical protein [Chloroflexota bacterium]